MYTRLVFLAELVVHTSFMVEGGGLIKAEGALVNPALPWIHLELEKEHHLVY